MAWSACNLRWPSRRLRTDGRTRMSSISVPAKATSAAGEADGSFVDRMLEVLRKTPVLRLEGNKTVTLKNVRPPAKTLSLSAEAVVPNGAERPVAFVFGPENGAESETLVYHAAKEASAKSYAALYVIGCARSQVYERHGIPDRNQTKAPAVPKLAPRHEGNRSAARLVRRAPSLP